MRMLLILLLCYVEDMPYPTITMAIYAELAYRVYRPATIGYLPASLNTCMTYRFPDELTIVHCI